MANDTQVCVEDLLVQQDDCEQGVMHQRMLNSFHGLADLGSESECEALDNSSYVVMSLNVSTTPVFIRSGICMPSSCSASMYMAVGKSISTVLTSVVDNLISSLGVNVYIAPPDVGLELSFQNTNVMGNKQLYAESEDSNSQTGLYGP